MAERADGSIVGVTKRAARPPVRWLARRLRALASTDSDQSSVPRVVGWSMDRSDFGEPSVAADGFPIPPREIWRSAAKSYDDFTAFGVETFARMRSLLADAGWSVSDASRILDFGSGSGRFVRMWGREAAEVWGCDLNADQIRWCQTFLSPPYRFVTTATFPSLPFDERTFDLVYAGSVFSHIPEHVDTWLLEIRRILRPGGVFYVTIHDEWTWDVIKRGEFPLLEPWMAMHPSGASERLPADFVVLGEGPSSNVFFRREYFASLASQYFEVRSATQAAREHQTAFVLQRSPD